MKKIFFLLTILSGSISVELIAQGIKANGEDLSFVTVKIMDNNGNLVPDANNLVKFSITGESFIAGADNGYQADLSSFKGDRKKAFNGLSLAVLQSKQKAGTIKLTETADGLQPATIIVKTK